MDEPKEAGIKGESMGKMQQYVDVELLFLALVTKQLAVRMPDEGVTFARVVNSTRKFALRHGLSREDLFRMLEKFTSMGLFKRRVIRGRVMYVANSTHGAGATAVVADSHVPAPADALRADVVEHGGVDKMQEVLKQNALSFYERVKNRK